MCQSRLRIYLHKVTDLQGVPIFLIRKHLAECSADRLGILEKNNPRIKADTDLLWKKHCLDKFGENSMPKNEYIGSWRQLFTEMERKREELISKSTRKLQMKRLEKEREKKRRMEEMRIPSTTRGSASRSSHCVRRQACSAQSLPAKRKWRGGGRSIRLVNQQLDYCQSYAESSRSRDLD